MQNYEQIIQAAKAYGVPDEDIQRNLLGMLALEQQQAQLEAPTVTNEVEEKPGFFRQMAQAILAPAKKYGSLVGEAGNLIGYKLSGKESRGVPYQPKYMTEQELTPFARQEGDTSELQRWGRGLTEGTKRSAGMMSYFTPAGGGGAVTAGGRLLTATGRGLLSSALYGTGMEESTNLGDIAESALTTGLAGAAGGAAFQGLGEVGRKIFGLGDINKLSKNFSDKLKATTFKGPTGAIKARDAALDIADLVYREMGETTTDPKIAYGNAYTKLKDMLIDLAEKGHKDDIIDINNALLGTYKLLDKYGSEVGDVSTLRVLTGEITDIADDLMSNRSVSNALEVLNKKINSKLSPAYKKLALGNDTNWTQNVVLNIADELRDEIYRVAPDLAPIQDKMSLLNFWHKDVLGTEPGSLWFGKFGAGMNLQTGKIAEKIRTKLGTAGLGKTPAETMLPAGATGADKAAATIGRVTGGAMDLAGKGIGRAVPLLSASGAMGVPQTELPTTPEGTLPQQTEYDRAYDLVSSLVPPTPQQFGQQPQLTPEKLQLIQAMAADPKNASLYKQIYEIAYGPVEQQAVEQSVSEKKRVAALYSVSDVIKRLIEYSYEAPTGMEGATKSLFGAIPGVEGGSAEMLRRDTDGFARLIASALASEVGVATDADVRRWKGIMPQPGDTMAERKDRIYQLITQVFNEAARYGVNMKDILAGSYGNTVPTYPQDLYNQ